MIKLEFDPGPALLEGENCVFSFRLTNAGERPLKGVHLWLDMKGVSRNRRRVSLLDAGQTSPVYTLEWEPEKVGRHPVRIAVGVPRGTGPQDGVDVFTNEEVIVRVATKAAGPSSVTIVYKGGEYAVGDVRLSGVGRQKDIDDDRGALLADDRRWLELDLSEDPEESGRRSRELRTDYHQRFYEELVAQGEEAQRKARAEMRGDPEEERVGPAVNLLKAALGHFNEAGKFAQLNIGETQVKDCDRRIDEVQAEIKRLEGLRPKPSSPESRAAVGPDPGGVLRNEQARLQVLVLPKREVSWGRHSERDVFLAREPFERPPFEQPPGSPEPGPKRFFPATEAERNFVTSINLSRNHFLTRWLPEGLEIEDHSSNGIWLERNGSCRRLPASGDPPAKVFLADGDLLHLAGAPRLGEGPVLSLEVTYPGLGLRARSLPDHPTGHGGRGPVPRVAVVRRVGKRPERQYLLLNGSALIGRNEDAAIVLKEEGVAETHATLLVDRGRLAISRIGAGEVKMDGQALKAGEVRALPDVATVELGAVVMTFRRFLEAPGGQWTDNTSIS